MKYIRLSGKFVLNTQVTDIPVIKSHQLIILPLHFSPQNLCMELHSKDWSFKANVASPRNHVNSLACRKNKSCWKIMVAKIVN